MVNGVFLRFLCRYGSVDVEDVTDVGKDSEEGPPLPRSSEVSESFFGRFDTNTHPRSRVRGWSVGYQDLYHTRSY